MARHLLTPLQVRNAKPQAKPYRLDDGDGLKLYIPPSGVISWQFRYRLNGEENTFSLGKIKDVSLKLARERAQAKRDLITSGVDPHKQKTQEQIERMTAKANTFAAVAEAWVKRRAKAMRWSDDHALKVRRSLGLEDTPRKGSGGIIGRRLGPLPITEIAAPLVNSVMREIEDDHAPMAEKIRSRIRAVFNYAVWEGLPVHLLPKAEGGEESAVRNHYAAITDLKGVGAILRHARDLDPQPCVGVQRADVLLAFTALRIGEIVGARWDEFALDGVDVPIGDGHAHKRDHNAGNWVVPRERMKQHKDKARGDHVVPLPPDLLRQLRAWREADGKDAVYVCVRRAGAGDPIAPETVDKHYRNKLGLEGKHSPHSWRSAFSTICREAGKDGDVVEAQLDHKVGQDKVASIYDRAKRLELRRELMAWYEKTLIAARDGATVHALPQRKPKA